MKTYANPVYAYRRCAEQDAASPASGAGLHRHPVVVVGAGPVGLACAIDLAQRGVPVVVLDEDETVSVGSRAICYAKRSLDILDRLGVGQRVVDKGIGWNVGKVFFRDELAYQFDLLPERGHRRPAFVNLQQYWLEQFLVERAGELPGIDLRWKHRVVGVGPGERGVEVQVETPQGRYATRCEWLVACDGARSPVRHMLGLEATGQVFRDRFLIADIHMQSDFPTERWFWFDPPFHRNQSVLLHRQADDVWRIDFQLGWDADPEEERKPERIEPRLRAMLGPQACFTLEWASVYTFQCRRMERFRHGRVLFAGDAAHVVSPFGARGANSGFQDADNLAWKLALVLGGLAPDRLLDSYDSERVAAADENLVNSTRSTDFITPKSAVSRLFRNAVLDLAKRHPFARRMVNSGRLSVPACLHDSVLNSEDAVPGPEGRMRPGAVAADAPVHGPRGDWLLAHVGGDAFSVLCIGGSPATADVAALATASVPCRVLVVGAAAAEGAIALQDTEGLVASRYALGPGACIVFRPDQHVCARLATFDLPRIRAAIARATCNA